VRKLCESPVGFNRVFQALDRSSAGALSEFYEFSTNSDRGPTLESLWCVGVLACQDCPTTLPQNGCFTNHSKSFIRFSYVICAFTYHIVELVFVLSYILSRV
jgi:hypothetical protein